MKSYLGLIFLSGAILLNGAEDLKIAMEHFQILPINRTQSGGKLVSENGGFCVEVPEKKSAFMAETGKHPVKAGGLAELEVTADGKGVFALQIYFFDADSGRTGWMTSNPVTLKEGLPITLKSQFRVSPDYANGKEVHFISAGLIVWEKGKIKFRDYKGKYNEVSKNTTLIPAVAEHGGIVVRTKELTELAKELRNKGKRPVMFLGDSITEGWRYPENGKPYPGGLEIWNRDFVPLGAENFGISAEKIEHVLYRITACNQLQCNPKAIVLMIGTNNLGIGARHGAPSTPEQIAEGIGNLLKIMKEKVPDSKLLLVAVTPRGGPYPTARINTFLPEIARKYGAVYVDPIPVMTNNTGNSKDRTVFRDGLHFSPKGYELYASVLLPALKEALQKGKQ